MSDGGSAQFNIDVDPSAIAALGDSIARSLDHLVQRASKSVGQLDNTVARQAPAMGAAAAKLGAATAKGLAGGIKSNSALVQQALIQASTQNVRGQQQAAQAAARAQLAAQQAVARQAIAAQTAAGKVQAVQAQTSGQLAVNAARVSGQQRIAITRFTLDTIGRLEKGLGAIIEGTARTVVGATKRIFAGTVGSLQRSFAERRSIITRELRVEQGLFANAAAVQQRASRGLVGFGLGAAGLIGGGALAAGAIRQVFTLGSDFSRGLNVLQAQLQLTDTQMAAVSKQALQLGNDISLPGVSALDAANAINLLAKQFASLGPAALQAAQDAAKGTLQLARAVGAPAEEAAQAVGAAVNVFKAPAADAVKIADQLAAGLSQAAGTSFSDFNLAFTQGAAVVSNFLVPAEGATNAITEFTSAIAILARGGIIGSDAGTSLKQFFLQANRGTDDANQALREISERAGVAGTAFFDQSGKARTLFETISILRRGLEGLTDEQKQNTIQTLFGADAARSASILIGQGEANFLKTAAAVQRQGAAAALAAAQNKGLAGAIDAIKSQFQTFAIQIFQKVNKPLGNFGLTIAGFIDKLANAGGVFAAVRAGLKGIGIALGGLVAIKGLVEIVGFARALAGALGPLGITAVILGGAIGFLLKRFGSFRGVLDAVGRLVDRVAPQVAKLRETIFTFLSGLAQRAQFLGRFSGFLQQIFTLLGQGKAAQAFDRLKVAAGALAENLAPVGRAFANLRKPIEAFIAGDFVRAFEGLKVVAGQIGRAISDVIGLALKTVDPFAGIGIDFVKKFKAQFIGGGIGALAGGLLLGPIGIPLGAALGVALTNALGKLKDIIGRVDVGKLFGNFLKGVEFVGRKIGEILSDKRVLLGVAGIGAAAAAIAGTFIKGFVSGILSNLGDIRSAGAEIVKALFNAPSIAKSIAAFVLLVRGLLTSQFKAVHFDNILGEQLGQGLRKSVATASLGDTLKAAFTTAGKKLGQALTVGIASALSGSALGSASSSLEKGLGIAGIAGSAAAAFTSFGGGPQGAIAAAATAGVGLLTAALTANAKKAAEAKAAMQDYKSALDAAAESGKSVAAAIGDIFGSNVKRATDDQLKAIQALGINLTDFQNALAAGKGPEFLQEFTDRFKELQTLASRGAQQGGSFLSREQQTELNNLRSGLPFLTKQINAVNDAGKRRDLEAGLKGANGQALITKGQLAGLAVQAEKTAAAQKRIGEQIRTERAKASMDVIKTGMEGIQTAAKNARQAVIDALNPPTAKTPQQAQAGAVTALPGAASEVGGAIETGITSVLGGAQLSTAIDGFKEQLKTAISDGAGNLFDKPTIDNNLAVVRLAIQQLAVGDDIKAQLTKGLDEFASTVVPIAVPLDAQADLLAAAAAGSEIAAATLASTGRAGPISVKSKADAVAAGVTGTNIVISADAAAQRLDVDVPSKANTQQASAAGSTIHSTAQKAADKPITVGTTVNISAGTGNRAGNAIARSVLDGFTAGIRGASASVNKTVTSTANGVTQAFTAAFRISSPSKVFLGIGKDVMKGLELGIKEGGAAAQSAIESVAKEMIDSTRSIASGFQSGLKTLFDDAISSFSITSGGNVQTAVGGLTTALRSVISQVSTNAQALWDAASKDAGQRTLAERLLLGESFVSLRAGDEFGVANRGAISGAVDAIKAIGEALLEQGFAARDAAAMLTNYRAQLVATAVQAGLSQAEVEALVDSLGLSAAGLNQFVANADRLNQVVAEGQRRASAPAPPLQTGPNPTQQFITNNLYLPTGDPEANALAVVNRQALAVR